MMRDRSGRRGALTLCILALGAGLVAADSAAAATISIGRSKDAITYGSESLRIFGELQPGAGASAAGRSVTLYEKPYPYKRSKVSARTLTGSEGRYGFRVQPEINSRYRVAVNDPEVATRSRSKLVVVFARGRLTGRATRDGHAEARFRLVYSPKLPTRLGGKRVSWYFHRLGTSRFTERDRSRAREPRRGALTGRGRWRLKPGRYRYEYAYCIDEPDRRDIGIGPPGVPRDCPRAFRASSRTLRSATGGSAAGGAGAGPVRASLSGSAAVASAVAG